jgi:outer membrane protein with beta-barrel domain
MKRLIWLLPVVLFCCASAQAQDTPSWELSGGYSNLWVHFGGTSFNLNGGNATATENVNSWFGGRLEFNGYRGAEAGLNVSAYTITYGPVFTYRRMGRVVPFAHVQLGAIHGTQGYLGISQDAFKFDATGGGGVDLSINRQLAVRVQADYMLTRFLGLNQNNLQTSVGLVYRFNYK